MNFLNWSIGTGIASPIGLAKETTFNLVILTDVAKGHGSMISIGSLDSAKCKGTSVWDSGPVGLVWFRGLVHDTIAQYRVPDSGFKQ